MGRRIALISSSFDPYPGGVEEHTRNVAREMQARGDRVEIWTVDRGEHLGTKVLDDIPIHYLPTPLPSASLRGVAGFAAHAGYALRAWWRVLRNFRPDVLQVQCFGPNGLYAWALHRLTGTPLVISSHGETFMDEDDVFVTSRVLSWGLRHSLHEADAVTGCSQLVLDDLTARFGMVQAGLVVPNGVDMKEPARLGIGRIDHDPATPLTIFAVGRLVAVKGFDLLIRAFATADLPDEAQLVIGGDGPELAALQSLADALRIAARVKFLGRLDRRQVITGMASADVVVVPSRIEAFGIVVLEAWRSGSPVVVTSHGGPGELVTDRVNGRVVDPFATQGFAGVLTELAGSPQQRESLALEGLNSVKHYNWGATAGLYEEVFDRVLLKAVTPDPAGPR